MASGSTPAVRARLRVWPVMSQTTQPKDAVTFCSCVWRPTSLMKEASGREGCKAWRDNALPAAQDTEAGVPQAHRPPVVAIASVSS